MDLRAIVFSWPGAVSREFIDLYITKFQVCFLRMSSTALECPLRIPTSPCQKDINSHWYFNGIGDALVETIHDEVGYSRNVWFDPLNGTPIKSFQTLHTLT
jgi:hypothetical protein